MFFIVPSLTNELYNLFFLKKVSQRWYYYQANKADCTAKIQPLAVFAEKTDTFIYCYFIGKPACQTLPAHSFLRQIASGETVFYAPKGINQAAYAGIDAAQDGNSVLNGPEGTDSGMLGKLGAGKNFAVGKSHEPAVVTYICKPIDIFPSLFIQCELSCYQRNRILIANHCAKSVNPARLMIRIGYFKDGVFAAIVKRIIVIVGSKFH
jgi:hypothetical protein